MTREQFIALVKSEQEALRGFPARPLLRQARRCRRHSSGDAGEGLPLFVGLSRQGQVSRVAVHDSTQHLPQPQGKQAHVRRHLCSTQRGVSNVSRLRLPPSGAVHGARYTLAQGALCSGDVLHERLLGEGDSRHHRLHHKRREAATLARQRQP